MRHLGTQTLETERLILRQFTEGDAEAMYQNWSSDPEVTRFLTWPAHRDVSVTRDYLREMTGSYGREDYYCWAIEQMEGGAGPIGDIAVVKHDDRVQSAHIGYCIGRKWWHQGITSEALACVMAFLFDRVGVLRVECRHDARNPNSGAVMKKCGMQYEGTLRQSDWNNQGICDVCYYAALAPKHGADRP